MNLLFALLLAFQADIPANSPLVPQTDLTTALTPGPVTISLQQPDDSYCMIEEPSDPIKAKLTRGDPEKCVLMIAKDYADYINREEKRREAHDAIDRANAAQTLKVLNHAQATIDGLTKLVAEYQGIVKQYQEAFARFKSGITNLLGPGAAITSDTTIIKTAPTYPWTILCPEGEHSSNDWTISGNNSAGTPTCIVDESQHSASPTITTPVLAGDQPKKVRFLDNDTFAYGAIALLMIPLIAAGVLALRANRRDLGATSASPDDHEESRS